LNENDSLIHVCAQPSCGVCMMQARQPRRANPILFRVSYRVGIFRLVSVGISWYLPYRYQRKTWSVFLVSKFWREPLKKLAGAPFFPRRGGLGPLFVHFALLLKKKGLTICQSNEIVQSHFSDGVLIVRYINKMATNGGGGVVDGVTLRRLQAILVPG
jgi:hypothetical protein